MKHIGIIGAGAMGSLFAYLLHKCNMHVLLYENESIIANEINKGLVVEGQDTYNFNPEISTDPSILRECDCVFLFVKSYATSDAAHAIKNSLNSNAIIVSLQNGLGNVEILKQVFNINQLVYGSTSVGATKLSLNSVRIGGLGKTIIGGENAIYCNAVKEVLIATGLEVEITDQPESIIWEKAIINSGINPLAALLQVSNIQLIENSHSRIIQDHVIREAVMVASAKGFHFNQEDMAFKTREVCRKTACNYCSMLQDLMNNRKTEIDTINGKIIEYGRIHAIETPYNETLYELIKARESSQ